MQKVAKTQNNTSQIAENQILNARQVKQQPRESGKNKK